MILAWYVNLEDIENEISEIANAIQNGEIAYELKYYAEVERIIRIGANIVKAALCGQI